MSLNKYVLNQKLIDKISLSIKSGRVFHAYIIEGDALSDKESFAKDFCKAILCEEEPGMGCDTCLTCRKMEHDNYEDFHFIESDGMSVKDLQIENLQAELKKKPVGKRHLALIKDADTLTVRAQNRLLKTLEEPFPGTVIILLSENRENLLETIRSRCVLYRLEDINEDSRGKEIADAVFDAISDGKKFYEMKEILSGKIKSREDAFALLDGLERIYEKLLTWEDPRRKIHGREEIIKAIEYIEAARRDILAKVNYQYALKNLILKIGG